MGHLCDFCGEQRSMVFCRSDDACLCLSCDRNVHSANALSRRHSRSLLCERCNLHPAIVRCVEEKISLCQNCDWVGHGNSTSASGHKRQTINCYSGCPSAAELSGIWSFVSELTSADDSNCEKQMGLMSLTENFVGNCLLPPSNNSTRDLPVAGRTPDLVNTDKSPFWMASSSAHSLNSIPSSVDQPVGSLNSPMPKLCYSGTKGLGTCDDLYNDFSMADVDLSSVNYEELFGLSPNHSEQFFENGGIDSLFPVRDSPGVDTNTQGAYIAEGSSAVRFKAMQPACSNLVSADSMMSSKTDPFCFPARQANSNLTLSFSGLTGESSTGDYQDCVVSSMFQMGEPPWYPPCPENSLPSASRDSAVLRYKEKKKTRKFDKKVRYASRKARADVRKRVKGRFVKAGDAFDYDPLCQTRSF
ncbi:hypothetical protein L1049_010357 [Liquidambar formosana]|uniref:Uncharacterized protein n=1 Tax=Liquidambar formosana TaxID=63359 RepID=A0AAP0NA43_LIQFO